MAPQREWFEKDYYRVLGVSETASAKEIKSAYRKLSRQYHPDANEGDAAAEERFKEVSAAYDVVGNEERRKEYDEVRRLGPAAAGFPGAAAPAASRSQGGDLGRPARRPVRPRRARRRWRPRWTWAPPRPGPRDRAPPHLRRRRRRAHHRGAPHQRRAVPHVQRLRRQAGHQPAALRQCGGQGVVSDNQGLFSFSSPCPVCGGRGVTIDDPCPTCRGTGVERRPREVKVRIPAGVADGQRIRLKGRGGPGQNGGPPGDLYVVVRVRGSSDLRPQGQRPHRHRADHVPRGRARRRHRGAHPRRGARHRPHPGGHRSGRTFRVKGRASPRPRPRATCSPPWRWRCPPSSAPPSARRWRRSKPHRTGPRPASTWGSDGGARDPARAVYVISVAAELAGLHPQTLRIYERKGLVDPARTGGGSRRYSDEDIAQLRRIQELTTEGLNLAGVQKVLELEAELAAAAPSPPGGPRRADEAVEQTHRQYRRDLVPLNQSIVRFRSVEPVRRANSGPFGPMEAIRVRWYVARRTPPGRCTRADEGVVNERRDVAVMDGRRQLDVSQGATTASSARGSDDPRSGATPRSSSMLVGGWPTLRPRPAPSSASDRRTWWAQRSGSWLLRRIDSGWRDGSRRFRPQPLVRVAPTSHPSPFGSRGDTTGRLTRRARSVGGAMRSRTRRASWWSYRWARGRRWTTALRSSSSRSV